MIYCRISCLIPQGEREGRRERVELLKDLHRVLKNPPPPLKHRVSLSSAQSHPPVAAPPALSDVQLWHLWCRRPWQFMRTSMIREERKGRVRNTVVLANVPSFRFFLPGEHANVPTFRFSFRRNIRMYPCSSSSSFRGEISQNHPFGILLAIPE